MDMNATLEQRATAEWSVLAGEPITCEVITGTIYAYGSELAMLRLEHKMRKGRAQYSEAVMTWTFCLDRK